MNPVKIAAIGGGNSFKQLHWPVYSALPEKLALKGMFDLNEEVLKKAIELSGTKPYGSLEELLGDKEVEVVLIATKPPSTHFQLCLKALEAGKNVIVEKPMAETAEQCDQMINAARKAKKTLTVFHNRRWDPYFLKIRNALESGQIGDPFLVMMPVRGSYEAADALYDWGVHIFDQALLLNRSRLREISGMVRYPDKGIFQTGMAISVLRFEKPPVIEYLYVPQEKQTTSDGHTAYSLPWHAVGAKGIYSDPAGAGGFPDQKPFYEMLWKNLRENGPVPVQPEEARDAIYVIEQTLASARLGKAVDASKTRSR